MKILIATGIYPPEIGGPASFTFEFAKELIRLGHEVQVICYGDEKTVTDSGWRVEVISKKLPTWRRYLEYTRAVYRAIPWAEHVFAQGPMSEGIPTALACRLRGKPYFMKVVGDVAWEQYCQIPSAKPEILDEFIKHRHAGKIRIMEALERWTAKFAKKLIVPSQYLKGITMAWGVGQEKIQVIINTVAPFHLQQTRSALRDQFRYQENEIVLFSVGRLVPWKHFDFIIGLLPSLPSNVRYIIGGQGPCEQAWKDIAQQAGIADRIDFTGALSRTQVGERMQAADFHILPSSYEGFPHVVAEAASLGLPSLVSDRGGNPETKDIFPEVVSVLPHLDAEAWKKRIEQGSHFGTPVIPQSFEAVTARYIEVLS